MNKEYTTNSGIGYCEAAVLLEEIRLRAPSNTHASLIDFAALTNDLISLSQTFAEGECEEVREKLSAFISVAIAEIKRVLAADQPSFRQIDVLSAEAIEQWGELIVALRENEYAELDGWYAHETLAAEEDSSHLEPEHNDLAVEALLRHFGVDSASSMDTKTCSSNTNLLAEQNVESALERTRTETAGIDSLDDELRAAFLDDSAGCLGCIESALLNLECNPRDHESLNQLLRELHTLKGASGSVGLMSLAEQIHELEESLRQDQASSREPGIDQLLHHVDRIRSQIYGPREPSADIEQVDNSRMQESIAIRGNNHFPDESGDDETVRVQASQLNRLMDLLVELVMLRNQRETELSELQGIYHELVGSVAKMRLLSNETDMQIESSKSLRLSEVANDVLESAQYFRNCIRPFSDGNAAVSRFIRSFRQELVELRRTPISGLFRRLQRVLRDAAQAEGKQVRLEMLGEDAGMERSLQQRLYEPLLHIVRNSVCHGIELPADRIRCGKPEEGIVSVEAKSGPDLFVIEVRDDGAGLNYEAIRRRGVERGLLAADHMASREKLSQLIFQPGFSTRESANQVGGRGVGMDVVAATMQRMRGWLDVSSEPGKGTRIRLSFPLPSVIQHAMVFRVASQLFALPMELVHAAGEVSLELPRVHFSELLGMDAIGTSRDQHAIVVANDGPSSATGKSNTLALMVDEILGPEELVVRPLPGLLRNHPFCVGATLSGMGQTVVLLDARRLLQSRRDSNVSEDRENLSVVHPMHKQVRVLVVDDSLSARKRVVRSLGRYRFEIDEAANGKQALDLLAKGNYACVFSDMEMPVMDGLEFIAELRSSKQKNTVPVVIISSRSEPEFQQQARDLGVAHFLPKPVANEALDDILPEIETLRETIQALPCNAY